MRVGRSRAAPLAAGLALALLASGLAVVLTDREQRLAATNPVHADTFALTLLPRAQVCQGGEFVPRDAAFVRIVPGTFGLDAPPLEVTLRGSGEPGTVARGGADGYADGVPLPVAIRPSGREIPNATVCVRNLSPSRRLALGGAASALAQVAGSETAGVRRALDLAYLRAGQESWLDLLPELDGRVGVGKARLFGEWTLWVVVAIVVGLGGAAVALVLRSATEERQPGITAVVWACGLVGFANALVWGAITPPFQVPDENKHVAYVERLGATGRPPTAIAGGPRSDELAVALEVTRFNTLVFDVRERPIWSDGQDRAAQSALRVRRSRNADQDAEGASGYPPLYYALAAVPVKLLGGTQLDRLQIMRLVSALLIGLTCALVVLFLRELLPGRRWVWAIGGVVVALQPTLGFVGGGVNNDNGVFAAAAASLWLVTRALRRGLTARLAVAIALATVAGLLCKPTMVGLLPGILVGILLATWRATPPGMRLRPVVALLGVTVVPLVVYQLVNAGLWDRSNPLQGGISDSTPAASGSTAPHLLSEQFAYVWSFYLPQLPFLGRDFFSPGVGVESVFLRGLIGRFAWQDTTFPGWVYSIGLGVYTVVLALAGVALARYRTAVRHRWTEALTCLSFMVGTLGLLHAFGYRYLTDTGVRFEQTRYLFVFIGLLGALACLAAMAGGRRAGPVIGVVLVVLALANDLFGMLLVGARFYG